MYRDHKSAVNTKIDIQKRPFQAGYFSLTMSLQFSKSQTLMRSTIIIPARYASRRFPGKPLALIADKTMLQRVIEIAHSAAVNFENSEVIVATDDTRIAEHSETLGVKTIMTSVDCPTGTDRCLEAVQQLPYQPDFVLNLQGDAAFTPVHFLTALLSSAAQDSNLAMATPAVALDWAALDQLRSNKTITPFSGTTVVFDKNEHALWFSKNIIPAIRNEKKLRETHPFSPIFQHIGLYLYRYDVLEQYVAMPQTPYERLEELEQLRLLENNINIRIVVVKHKGPTPPSGIDSLEDLKRAEDFIKNNSELNQ